MIVCFMVLRFKYSNAHNNLDYLNRAFEYVIK